MFGLGLDDMLLDKGDDVTDRGLERTNGEDGKLEQEHDHHGWTGLLDDCVESIFQDPSVVDDAEQQGYAQPGVEEARVCRRLLLEDLNTTLTDPTPDLACDKGGKHDEEVCADLLAENGHCQTSLGDSEPCFLVKLFDLDGAEAAETEPLKTVDE